MNQGLGASAHKPSCFSPLLAPCFSTASAPSIHWLGPGHEAGRDGARHATHGPPVELWDWDTLVPRVLKHEGVQHQAASIKHHDKSEGPQRKRENLFLLLFKQEASLFHFSLGSTDYVASTGESVDDDCLSSE